MNTLGIRRQLHEAVGAAIHVSPDEIDPTATFDAMGFDSMSKVGIVPSLEQLFNCTLVPEMLFDHPTLESLENYILGILCKSEQKSDGI
jgi:acyl carrier protein